jgi:hypothetical protein
MANATTNEPLGIFSLRAAAWGIVLPMLVITFLVAFHADLAGPNRTTIAWLVGAVFLILEVFAILSGLGAWASAAGKIGTLLALVILVGGLAAGAAVFSWPVPLNQLIGRKAEPAHQPVKITPPPATPSAPAPKAPESEPPAPEKPIRRGPPGELFPNVPPQK